MAAPPQTTGFVNLNRYLDANQGDINKEANAIAGNDTQAANAAMATPLTTADYAQQHGAAQAAYNNLSGLNNSGSLQDQVRKTYGGGQGQNSFDASLLGASGQAQGTFADARKNVTGGMEGLKSYLDYTPPAPTPEKPAPGPSSFGQETPAKPNPWAGPGIAGYGLGPLPHAPTPKSPGPPMPSWPRPDQHTPSQTPPPKTPFAEPKPWWMK